MPAVALSEQYINKFSILHISDLHKDLQNEIDNSVLLAAIERDIDQYSLSTPQILKPTICLVTGDLVYGVKSNGASNVGELERQYAQVESFLSGLADRFFEGNRERIILLPGNHDVGYDVFMSSLETIGLPTDEGTRRTLVSELFSQQTRLRWSWELLGFLRITNASIYASRFQHFASMYHRFYQGKRTFSSSPEEQHGIFDFKNLGLCILALNSCYNNDPLHRCGAFNPTSIAEICRAIRERKRIGWLIIAAWHHNLSGGPNQDDYLDTEVIQSLIDAGVSLGFHGHQHLPECVDERYRVGTSRRKMTIISAGTLCAGPRYLFPGVPRSFNVVEIDTSSFQGRVHKRQMVNQDFTFPIWGPGHFNSTNNSYLDFELCNPLQPRPSHTGARLLLESADRLLGSGQLQEAISILETLSDVDMARPLLLKALTDAEENGKLIDLLWPPQNTPEAISIGGALIYEGPKVKVNDYLNLELVSNSSDASILEVTRRLRERWTK